MLLKKTTIHPNTLLMIAMTSLAIALPLQHFIPRFLDTDLADGARGMLLGIAIGLNLLYLFVAGSRLRRP